jgi:hypothetical protein
MQSGFGRMSGKEKNYPIPVSNGIFAHRKRIGAAVWVFLWLIDHTTKEIPATDGKVEGLVHGGQPVALGTIASDLEMSWDAVYEHLGQLANAGYIRKLIHGNGRPNGYAVINSKRFSNRRTKTGRSNPETPVQKTAGTTGQITRGTPVQNAIDLPAFVREPTDKSPSVYKEEVLQDNTRHTKSDLVRAIEIWNRQCGDFLPKVIAGNESRRKKLKTRIAEARSPEGFFGDYERAVTLCATTPFLSGKNERGWTANFDWLVENDLNLQKVLEGRYRTPGAASSARRGAYDSVADKLAALGAPQGAA